MSIEAVLVIPSSNLLNCQKCRRVVFEETSGSTSVLPSFKQRIDEERSTGRLHDSLPAQSQSVVLPPSVGEKDDQDILGEKDFEQLTPRFSFDGYTAYKDNQMGISKYYNIDC
ncbi:hypothetical protein HHI36_015227 [Cryptolaemus montrouzieri]|uniref:Uncharacterized protein n=1 Tax=Cryptolaemus montrouzieri TaxID=559131 RepID=A0ABD2N680_9CUCU